MLRAPRPAAPAPHPPHSHPTRTHLNTHARGVSCATARSTPHARARPFWLPVLTYMLRWSHACTAWRPAASTSTGEDAAKGQLGKDLGARRRSSTCSRPSVRLPALDGAAGGTVQARRTRALNEAPNARSRRSRAMSTDMREACEAYLDHATELRAGGASGVVTHRSEGLCGRVPLCARSMERLLLWAQQHGAARHRLARAESHRRPAAGDRARGQGRHRALRWRAPFARAHGRRRGVRLARRQQSAPLMTARTSSSRRAPSRRWPASPCARRHTRTRAAHQSPEAHRPWRPLAGPRGPPWPRRPCRLTPC